MGGGGGGGGTARVGGGGGGGGGGAIRWARGCPNSTVLYAYYTHHVK